MKKNVMVQKIKYYISRFVTRKPVAIRNSEIDKRASIGNGAQIVDCVIGKYTYIFESKVIFANIGCFCSIAADCTIGGGSHPIQWVSTSPTFYAGKNSLHKNFSQNNYDEYQRTIIGNDVWIGSKCLIKGGVTIGDGAIVGMGSVVTHDIPAYEIWAGNPAHFIKKRFSEETIEKLVRIQWWDYDDSTLEKLGNLFNDPKKLVAYMEEKK